MPLRAGQADSGANPSDWKEAAKYVEQFSKYFDRTTSKVKELVDGVKKFATSVSDGVAGVKKLAEVLRGAGDAATAWTGKATAGVGNWTDKVKDAGKGAMSFKSELSALTAIANMLEAVLDHFGVKLDNIGAGFDKVDDSLGKSGEMAKKVKGHFEGMSSAGVAGMLSLVDGLKSFARQGLEGTGAAAMLSFETQQLARGVAAVFLPAIETAIDVIRRLSDWFHSLTESQQNAIQALVVGVGVAKAATFALGAALGEATGGVSILIGAVAGLVMAGGDLGGVGEAFSGLMDALKPVLDVIEQLATTTLAALQPAIGAVIGIVQTLGSTVGDIFGGLMADAKPFIDLMAGQLVQVVKVAGNVLQGLAPVLGLIADAFGIVMQVLSPLMEAFNEVTIMVGTGFADLLKDLKPTFDQLKEALAELGVAFGELMEMAKPVIAELMAGFDDLMHSVLMPVLKWILHEFVDGIKTLMDWVIKAVATLKGVEAFFNKGLKLKDFQAYVSAQVDAMHDKANAHKGGGGKTADGKPGRGLEVAPGGFEAIEQMFKRIQTAASETGGKSKDDEALEEQRKTAKNTEDILNELKGNRDPVGEPPPMD